MDPYLSIPIVAGGLILPIVLWKLSPTLRHVVKGAVSKPPNLVVSELPSLFDTGLFNINHNPRKTLVGADRSMQIYNDDISIIYYSFEKKHGFTEVVDIACLGKCGMIFTLVNGKMTRLERVDGTCLVDPKLSHEETKALLSFMKDLRMPV